MGNEVWVLYVALAWHHGMVAFYKNVTAAEALRVSGPTSGVGNDSAN